MWNMYRNLNVFKSLINTPKQVLPPKHSQFPKAIVTLKTGFKRTSCSLLAIRQCLSHG